jgi:uncharacterized protein YndB with AHSA1/START domain
VVHAKYALRIERELRAPPERIYAAFGRSELLREWWCPPAFAMEHAIVDFKVGGHYEIHVRSMDGAMRITIRGEFLELTPQVFLRFTHSFVAPKDSPLAAFDGHAIVSVELSRSAKGTRLVLTEEGIPTESVKEVLERGWPALLEQLGASSRSTNH